MVLPENIGGLPAALRTPNNAVRGRPAGTADCRVESSPCLVANRALLRAVVFDWGVSNRSRRGLSTQLSKHSRQSCVSNRSPALTARHCQDRRLQGMPRLQQWWQPERGERTAPGPMVRLVAPGATSATANANANGRPPDGIKPDLPLQFSGLGMLGVARHSGGPVSSTSSRAEPVLQPRPPTSPGRPADSAFGGSALARPNILTGSAPTEDPDRRDKVGEASISSLVSQSSRRLAQTLRSKDTGNPLGLEASQSAFTRIHKRGGVAKRVTDRRESFGGGFSTATITPRQAKVCTAGSIRKGRPPVVTPSESWETVSPQAR